MCGAVASRSLVELISGEPLLWRAHLQEPRGQGHAERRDKEPGDTGMVCRLPDHHVSLFEARFLRVKCKTFFIYAIVFFRFDF